MRQAKILHYLDKNVYVKELVITRVFDAPRDILFKAWTESRHLKQWFGPQGYRIVDTYMDLRPGGIFHYGMLSTDGKVMWGKFVYREVMPQEQIVFINSFSDEDQGIIRHPQSNTWPLEVLNMVTFTEQDGKTMITLKGWPINATTLETKTFEEGISGIQEGVNSTFDQLDEYLSKFRR